MLGNYFKQNVNVSLATGWCSFVKHDAVKVCGMIGKETFLRWYMEREL